MTIKQQLQLIKLFINRCISDP